MPPARHLFVCTNPTGSGKPTCGASGERLIAIISRMLIERRASSVLVTPTACLGPCFDGPNAVIYPDGDWYAHLDPDDATALVEALVDGVPFAAKRTERPGD